MNWVDVGIIALILYQAAIGFRAGVLRGVLDLGGLLTAVVIATTQVRWGGDIIQDLLSAPPPVARWLSFLLGLGLLTLIVRGMISLLSRLLRQSRRTWSDRIGGTVLGSLRGGMTASLLLVLFTLMPLPAGLATQIDQSPLAPSTLDIVPSVYDFLAAHVLPRARPFYEQLDMHRPASSTTTVDPIDLTAQRRSFARVPGHFVLRPSSFVL